MTVKLTRSQRELLMEVYNGEHACVEEYRPAQALVALGLAEFRLRGRLYATPAGARIFSPEAPASSKEEG